MMGWTRDSLHRWKPPGVVRVADCSDGERVPFFCWGRGWVPVAEEMVRERWEMMIDFGADGYIVTFTPPGDAAPSSVVCDVLAVAVCKAALCALAGGV